MGGSSRAPYSCCFKAEQKRSIDIVARNLCLQEEDERTRANEWWVPKWGPRRFRLLIGMSFFPYSLMNASYVLIGSLLAPTVHLDRMLGMALVYLVAVGLSAHSLDAISPNKPWGAFLSRAQLLTMAVLGLGFSLSLGLYYALSYSLLLVPLGLLELFFLLAYNLEWFGGRFHSDFWFAFSWGYLPILVGYAVQVGELRIYALAAGLFGFFTALVEINASRPYKALKREPAGSDPQTAAKLESILKGIVATVLSTAAFLLVYRFLP